MFVCAFPMEIYSIFGKSFAFPFPYFVLFVLWYFPFHMFFNSYLMTHFIRYISTDSLLCNSYRNLWSSSCVVLAGFFLVTLVILTAFTTLLLVYPVQPLAELFELVPVSHNPELISFRLYLLVFPTVHLIASVFVEVRSMLYNTSRPPPILLGVICN